MNRSLKTFLSIFCYISAVVGIVLAAVNASEKPAETSLAVGFGVAGVVFLGAGFLLTRKPRY